MKGITEGSSRDWLLVMCLPTSAVRLLKVVSLDAQKYAVAEFDIPYSATRAKKALDQIENAMKPDQNKRGGGGAQVKLLRSEFAAIKSVQAQFSKILFVSNLPPVSLPHCWPHLADECCHLSLSGAEDAHVTAGLACSRAPQLCLDHA